MPQPRLFFLAEGTGPVRVGFPEGGRMVQGLEALQQQVILHLLATPGSDRYTPAGGGLARVIRDAMQGQALAESQVRANEAVARTQEQLLASQATLALTAAEQLASLALSEVEVGEDRRLRLTLDITNQANETLTITI